MNKVELYIDNLKCELFEDESISLTQTIKNVKELDTIFSDYSQDFNLPANSRKNQLIFKRYENVNVIGGYDNRVKHPATILMNGILFKKGYVQLNKVKVLKGKADSYSVQFVGGLSNFKKVLKDNKLKSLISLDITSESFSINAPTVESMMKRDRAFTSTQYPKGYDVLYSLITSESGVFYDSNTIVDDTPNAFYDTVVSHDNGLDFKHLKPSIRVNRVIEAIEDTYNVSFSSDFFKNDTIDKFNYLFLHLNNVKGQIALDDDDESYKQSSYVFNNWSLNSDGADTPSFAYDITANNAGRIFITDIPVFCEVGKVNLTATPVDKTLEYQVRVYRISSGEVIFTDWLTGDHYLEFDSSLSGELIFTAGLQGDNELDIVVEWNLAGSNNDYKLEASVLSNIDVPFSISNNMPDITIASFLKGLFQMFNLVAYEDIDGTIVVEPMVDYVADGVDTDITKYVDDESITIDGSYQYAGVNLKYQEAKDKISLEHENFDVAPYGSFVYSAVEINTGGKEYEVELPFAIMKYDKLTDDFDDSGTFIQIGRMVDKDDNPIITKPLLYYPCKVSSPIAIKEDISNNVKITSFNSPSNNLELNYFDSKDTITFGLETDTYSRSRQFTNNLWNVYYNRYLSPVFNIRGRLIKVTAYLPIGILTTFSLRDRFVYKNVPYRINSIKTDLQTGKSDIELLGDSVFQNGEFSIGNILNPPVITILGSNPDTIEATNISGSYIDAGATATDVEDGNLTSSIEVITPDIDESSVGVQNIRYKVTDSDNNTVIVTRLVIIEDTTAPIIFDWSYASKTSTTVTIDYDINDAGTGVGIVRFYRKLSSSSDWILVNSINGGGQDVAGSNVFKNLTSATSYDFKCEAMDLGGLMSTSSTVTQTTS